MVLCSAGPQAASGGVTVAERFSLLHAAIDQELECVGRPPGSVTIVGVAKFQPVESVREAIDAGLRDVAHNYLQEGRRGFERLPPVRKHFIGRVQSNKARAIATLFDVVQSVDRLETGLSLARAASALDRELSVLIQVDAARARRHGCSPEEACDLAARLRNETSLRVDGIMAIAPPRDPAAAAKTFATAAKTFALVGGSTLSIGMSGDWREAVRAGSTMVRIGAALFGERDRR